MSTFKQFSLIPIFALLFATTAVKVQAAPLSFSPASGELTAGEETTISLQIDQTDTNLPPNDGLQSATALISYDESKASISVEAGSSPYFPTVSSQSGGTGKIFVYGNPASPSDPLKTGSGTMAQLKITPSDDFSLSFICNASGSDDTEIFTYDSDLQTSINLLTTEARCNSLGTGSYTVVVGSNPTSEPTTAPADDPADDDGGDTTNDGGDTTNTTTTNTTKGGQPVQPTTLPETGAMDYIKWIVSGLALVGVGLLLL